MENQREHGKKDVAEKTSKEITVNSLAELFADDEFGFEMFIICLLYTSDAADEL